MLMFSFDYKGLIAGSRVSNSSLDGSFIKLLNQIEKTHLIILDDLGLHPMDGATRPSFVSTDPQRQEWKEVSNHNLITSQFISDTNILENQPFPIMRIELI